MSTRTEELIGRSIAGYRLLEVLARGGMSIVFLAQRLDPPQERVAFKILVPPDHLLPEDALAMQGRFLREAQAAYQLHHEHILPVLGYGSADNIFYMVMPVITGGTLTHLLANREEPLPLAEISNYLQQLASAIDYAHNQGLIHRDIKPSNALLDGQGQLYLADFGIVQLFTRDPLAIDQAPTSFTSPGQIYGTTAYMAPERLEGRPVGPAADIYSLGILLYQLVTGHLPFQGADPLIVAMKHVNEMPEAPRTLRPDLPEPAEAAILRALAKEPADRFATAAALAAAFDAGIRGEWVPELLPFDQDTINRSLRALPAAALVPFDDQQEQHQAAGLAPLILTPAAAALASADDEATMANVPAQAHRISPLSARATRLSPARTLLLMTAISLVVAALAFLLLLAAQPPKSSPTSGRPTVPTTSQSPTKSTVATPTHGVTPTLSPRPTATPGVTPTLTPPKPTPTVGVTPVPTVAPTPVPTVAPTTVPTVAPTPTP